MRETPDRHDTMEQSPEKPLQVLDYRDVLPEEGLLEQDRIAISVTSRKLLHQILSENPDLDKILHSAPDITAVISSIREWMMRIIGNNSLAANFYEAKIYGKKAIRKMSPTELAAIRILDYLDHSGKRIPDLNRRGELTENHPFKLLWLARNYGRSGARPAFFQDMLMLFRQLRGVTEMKKPDLQELNRWMDRHPSGLDPDIIRMHQKNKERILNLIINKIDQGSWADNRYYFPDGASQQEKKALALQWWNERLFHLRFAARDADTLNEMLDGSLDAATMALLREGTEQGIPIFVNPYYLSLLLINPPAHLTGCDQPIRDYIFYSKELLHEFGSIVAWEKEDEVEPGKPNAAGWILPNNFNLHRRYPDVAILIPDTVGRSCGGLCVSCQRMYDFQRGNLNFELDRLKPRETWWEKLEDLMEYFENDSRLCDILITGGDALMSANKSLRLILDAVYRMAMRKRKANQDRKPGEKYAGIKRVRLGTRLPVYIPMRITDELVEILAEFRQKARQAGIRQLVIQTHFESALEVTPEAREGIRKLLSAGWMVTNQQVFTASASRRGHTAKLRKVLSEIGVLPYYTFTVKGYMENYRNFAPNARSVQEQIEEKSFGKIPDEYLEQLKTLPEDPTHMVRNIRKIMHGAELPFLATDRNMLNLPGVGKSMTFRTIGITRHGRRILEFDHDETRSHSPVVERMGKVTIIESKPIFEYLRQLGEMGEEPADYAGIYDYSIGFSEKRLPVYKYPRSEEEVTEEITNFQLP